LSEAGVRTLNVNAVGWLRNEVGIVRGFQTEKRVLSKKHGRYTPSKPAIDYLVRRLKTVDEHPRFIHTHLIDAHAPYTLGGTKGSPFDRYLRELELVDRGLSRLLATIERRHLEARTFVILLADHGEAFGEHGANTHGTNLYDEALHVPLMIHGPGIEPRKIEDLVSTMDVGPTILDLFGLPIPRYFMGQSLAGYMMGENPRLSRPVLAEARLMRTLVMPNGLKVIYDTRTKQVELYHLGRDPKELEDLSDDEELLAEPLALLHAFFEVHGYDQNGYTPPFVR
jgi:arylsulfatase A-like enzyme